MNALIDGKERLVTNRSYQLAVGMVLVFISVIADMAHADDEDEIEDIKTLQMHFIGDVNHRTYDKVMAAFDGSYQGVTTEKGLLILGARGQMFKDRFASKDDPGTITILETEVRPLGNDYVLLTSHLKNDRNKGKVPKDWWYTAIYARIGGEWKIIHEQ